MQMLSLQARYGTFDPHEKPHSSTCTAPDARWGLGQGCCPPAGAPPASDPGVQPPGCWFWLGAGSADPGPSLVAIHRARLPPQPRPHTLCSHPFHLVRALPMELNGSRETQGPRYTLHPAEWPADPAPPHPHLAPSSGGQDPVTLGLGRSGGR